jgi:hypothetical protein
VLRTGTGFTRRMLPVCLAILVAAVLLGATTSPGAAALASSGTPTCAPPIPPPVAGSPVAPPATAGIVLINEILTSPGSTWNCAGQGTFSLMSDSWVELYNPQSQPFNLYAVHAYFDTGPTTFRFYFPFGAAIAPYGFLVVFPNSAANTLLASSNLRLMFAASSTVIDQVSIPGLAVNDSYARIPDGSSSWKITATPTIDASNIASSPTSATPTSPAQGSGSGSTQATPAPVLATGTQPAWNRLSLPPSTPEAAAASPTSFVVNNPLVNTPVPASGASDVQRRVLLTVLLVLLAASLFWCWKSFLPRN